MVGPLVDPLALTDQERTRILRHAELLGIWRGLSAEELLSDQQVLLQLVAFAVHRAALLATAREQVALGAGHECGEWIASDRRCQVCGQEIPPAPPEVQDVW